MGMTEAIDGLVEEKLLNLHTAFIGKVVSVQSAYLCTVQPLDKTKAYGKTAKQYAVITRVPVLRHVGAVHAGDIVLCVCAERDISSAVKGQSTTPPVGHHQIKDAIVVGVIGG